MTSVGRGLLRVAAGVLVAVAVGPVGTAMAEAPNVTIASPRSLSVTSNPTPSFRGLAEEADGGVTLAIYEGAAELTVNPPPCSAAPSIETPPANQTVTAPAEASFTVTEGAVPSGCSAATIQWQVSTDHGSSWSSALGATSATLSINPTSTTESKNEYRAELTNANVASPTFSSAAELTVNPAPPIVTLTSPANGSSTSSGSQEVSGSAGTAIGDSSVAIQLFSGATTELQVPLEALTVPVSSGSWSGTFGGLSPGAYTVRAEQSDNVGNSA
jgi:hypothetical protein